MSEWNNLGLEGIGVHIFCQGYGGMKLWQVKRKLWNLLSFVDAPSYRMVHSGGNDIGEIPIHEVRRSAKIVLDFLKKNPTWNKLIWSHVLTRKYWLHSQNKCVSERCRVRLNSHAASESMMLEGIYRVPW